MKKKSLMIYGILLIISLAFVSCTTTATQTLTTTITIPQTTNTQTISSTEVMNFLAGIKNIYTNGGIVQGDAPPLSPTLKGISESDFLSLSVPGDTIITMGGISYSYVAINPITTTSWSLPSEMKLGTYLIDLSIPNTATIGGTPISIHIDNNSNSALPFSTNFTYYYIPLQITTCSVYIETHSEGNLRFLFMYYYPSSSSVSQKNLWLVLLPYQGM
jgi:hypothetical protein